MGKDITPASQAQVKLYNRKTGRIQEEVVFAEDLMKIIYCTGAGLRFTDTILSRRLVSRIYGWFFKSPLSRRRIETFVQKFDIDMAEVEIPPGGFKSFNDFFTRRLKPGARPIPSGPDILISPADSRARCFDITRELKLDIKGATMSLDKLISAPSERLDGFIQGTGLQFRLAPSDYHRFCYVDDGLQGPVHTIDGRLHSVSPVALARRPEILQRNFRQFCFMETRAFGTLLQVEVGAMTVGSIVQHLEKGGPVSRGMEKGYFALGGSTILVLFAPGTVQIHEDIRHYSRQGIETLVRMGEPIGMRLGRPGATR